MNKHKLIEISEYLFLGLTIAGTVGAAMTQQVVYIAVPLTFSIALNLINRPRLYSSQSSVQTEQIQADLDNFSNRIDQLQITIEKSHRQSLNSEPVTESMEDVNTIIIAERLNNLTTNFEQYSQQFTEISERLSEVEIAVELITQSVKKQGEELQSLEKSENSQLKLSKSEVNEEISNNYKTLDTRYLQLEQTIETLSQNHNEFTEIANRLSGLENSLEMVTQTINEQSRKLQNLEKLDINEDIRNQYKTIDNRCLKLEQAIETLSQNHQNHQNTPTELNPYPTADNSIEETLEISAIPTEFGEFYNPVETNYSLASRDVIQDTVSLEFEPNLYNMEIEVEQNLQNMEIEQEYPGSQFDQTLAKRNLEETIPMLEFDQLIPSELTGSQDNELISGANLKGHKGKVLSVDFSPNSKFLASGSDDKTLKIWDLETQQHRTFVGHQDAAWSGAINAVGFSIDGKIVASGSDDKTIKLWDVETGNTIITFTGHEEKICSLAFSPLGKILASGSKDKTVKLWHLEKNKQIYSLKAHQGDVLCVVFSPDGKLLATAGDGQDGSIKIIKLAESKVRTIKVNSDWFSGSINTLAFSPDGKFLASGDNKKTIKLWDVETSQEIKSFNKHSDHVMSIAFSADGKLLASGSKDKTVKLWDVKQGVEIASMQCGNEVIYSVAFSPDGKLIAAGSGDKTITILPVNA